MGKASRSRKKSASGVQPREERTPHPVRQPHGRGFLQKTGLHAILIILFGFLIYSNTFHTPFHWDDLAQILENPVIKDLDNFMPGSEEYAYRYSHYNPRRSIGYLTFALNHHFGGLAVTGYHVTNLAIHIANALLVYLLILLTFRTPFFSSQLSAISDQLGRHGGRPENPGHSARGGTPLFPDSRFTPAMAGPDSRFFIALFTALLFVSHPLQTQAVTYLVQRFTSLAALFYLLSMVLYVQGRLITERARGNGQEAGESEKSEVNSEQEGGSDQQSAGNSRFTPAMARHGSPGNSRDTSLRKRPEFPMASRLWPIAFFFFSLVSAVCAMKTKEIAFTLPLMIFAYETVFFRSPLRKKIIFLIGIAMVLAVILIGAMYGDKSLGEMLSDMTEKTRVQTQMPRWDYLMTQLRVITTYARLIFLPVNQNFDYDYPVYRSLFTPSVFLSFLFLASLLGLAVRLLYRSRLSAISHQQSAENSRFTPVTAGHDSRLVAFGILWFFIALSVESSIIPIKDVIFEHRVYLPSVGFFLALVAGVVLLFQRLFLFTIHPSLFTRGAAALFAMMVLLLGGLTYARNAVWTSTITLWEDIVSKSPGKPRVHNNLGTFYFAKGLDDKGLREFQTALELNPNYPDAHFNLGFYYHRLGRLDEAMREYETVLMLYPDSADAHNNIGAIYEARGNTDEAIREIQAALRLNPDHLHAKQNLERLKKTAGDSGDDR